MKPVGSPEGPLLPERWGGAIPAACEPQAAPASVGAAPGKSHPGEHKATQTGEHPHRCHLAGKAQEDFTPPRLTPSQPCWTMLLPVGDTQLLDTVGRAGAAQAPGSVWGCSDPSSLYSCSGSQFPVGLLTSQFPLFLLRLPVPVYSCSGSRFPLFLFRLPVLSVPAQIPVLSRASWMWQCLGWEPVLTAGSAGSWSVPAAGQYQDPPGHCSGPLGTRSSVNPSCSPLGAALCSPVNSKPCHNVLFPEKLGFVFSKSL